MNLAGIRPEDELILCCARTAIDEHTASRIHALLRRSIDWRYLLESATHHRVIPLFYRSLLRSGAGPIPTGVSCELAHQCGSIVRRNLSLMARLIRLSDWIHRQGICAIPYKGPALAVVAYGNIGLRQFGDLDVLVRSRDYLKARDLLLAQGYRASVDWGWECSLVDDACRVTVDLHKGLAPAQFPVNLNFKGLWERREPLSIAGGQISTLCAEDLLVVLCVQLIKDGWGESTLRLSKVCDIAELLRAKPNIDWKFVLDEVGRAGCRRLLWVSLAVAHQLLGAPVFEAMPRPPSDSSLARLVAHIVDRIFHDSDRHSSGRLSSASFHFKIRERWRDKLYPLYHDIKLRLSPNELDRAVLKLPPSLNFLHYLIRPVRVTRDRARAIFKLSKAKWASWIR